MIFTTTLALALTHSSHGKVSLTVVNRSALNPDPLSLKIKFRPHRGGNGYNLSLSYLDDPKAWLRDEDIANICHEIYKGFTRQPWTGFQNLDWFCHYPIPADLIPIKLDRVRDNFICDNLSWSRLLISEHVMFVPLNLGRSHWTLLALDSRPRSRCALGSARISLP